MIYEKWDKKLWVKDNDIEQSTSIPQLINREVRIFKKILRETKHNYYEAYDEFLKEILNSNSLPTFSESYKACKMWNQEKRLTTIKDIMDRIYSKFTVVKEK